MNDRIEEIRETWEKAYKGLVKDLGNERTFEEGRPINQILHNL